MGSRHIDFELENDNPTQNESLRIVIVNYYKSGIPFASNYIKMTQYIMAFRFYTIIYCVLVEARGVAPVASLPITPPRAPSSATGGGTLVFDSPSPTILKIKAPCWVLLFSIGGANEPK